MVKNGANDANGSEDEIIKVSYSKTRVSQVLSEFF